MRPGATRNGTPAQTRHFDHHGSCHAGVGCELSREQSICDRRRRHRNSVCGYRSATYWGTTNGTNGGSILPNGPGNGYVPEQAWNDDDEFVTYCQQNPGLFCTQGGTTRATGATGLPWVSLTSEATAQEDIGIGSGSGGASNCAVQTSDFSACVSGFPKPSWQTVTVSGQTTRMLPDISLLATPNFPGFIYCTQEVGRQQCASGIANAVANFSIIGGTSASAPIFAGMVALLNQYTASSWARQHQHVALPVGSDDSLGVS